MSPPRILFDLSATMRWIGPPVGILRAEGEFARFARRKLPGTTFVFFDPDRLRYVALRDDVLDAFLQEDAVIDTIALPDPTGRRRHKSDLIPARLRPAALCVLQARHQLLGALDRLRRAAPAPLSRGIDRLQRALMTDKDRGRMVKADGSRRLLLTPARALGAPVAFRRDDVLVCAGTGWVDTNIAAIVRHKQDVGFSLVLACYDLMPLMFPDCFQAQDTAMFRDYVEVGFPAADLVVVNAARIEQDVRDWCRARGLSLANTAVVPLGADGPVVPPTAATPAALPAELTAGRYALFVSTIEPRKNHRLLVEAWRRLLAAGVPQAAGFKLVFVGRIGWTADDLMRDIASDPDLAGTLLHLPQVADSIMTSLYGGAAFCCYPSRYEGYGLPVVEAFRFGKAVLASTGGALPEVVDAFSPCLDPNDVEAWTAMLRRWIEEPAARAPFEEAIRTAFRHPGWDEAAALFFARVRETADGTTAAPPPDGRAAVV